MFIKKIQQYITEKKLLADGDHVIIGLSGGADSVCLLLVLKALQPTYHLTLTAVHVHHGIRGESAERDLRFSKELCEANEVEFVAAYRDVPGIAAKLHLTEEEAGRSVRYEIFEQEARKRGASVIAVAHHMDDQAETVLMNLLRGSGIRGCGGIQAKRLLSDGRRIQAKPSACDETHILDKPSAFNDSDSEIFVVRPLLGVRRSEIEAWLTAQNQTWCTDETNLTDEYLRSRIRNNLLPLLEREYNAQAAEHIAAASGDFFEAEEYLRSRAKEIFASWQDEYGQTGNVIPLKELSAEKPILQRYLIQEAIKRTGSIKDVGRTHIEAVLGLLTKTTGSQIHLPGGRIARCSYGFLVIETQQPKTKEVTQQSRKTKKQPLAQSTDRTHSQPSLHPAAQPGRTVYSVFPICEKKNQQIPQSCCVNWFDYDTIKEGLLMRRRRPKDRICIDARGNTQKLSDCMINAKIPAARRDQIPILASKSRVLWIAGMRMAEDCKVTQDTRLVLEVRADESITEGLFVTFPVNIPNDKQRS